MVCANKEAYYVRQFDVMRKKLGLNIVSSMYQTALEHELQGSTAALMTDADDREEEETHDRPILPR
jgi:hypothetical protein